MSQQSRRIALLACSATVMLGLTACSSGAAHPSAAGSAAPPAAAGAPAKSPAAGTDGLPNGNKLNAMLLPAAAIPSQLKIDASGTRSTGDGFNPPLSPSAAPAGHVCDALNASNWVDAAGIASASFAQNDYTDDSQDMFAQELDAFRGNEAQAVMAGLKQVLTTCHTYTRVQNGQNYTVTVTLKSLPGVGDEAIQAVATSPDLDGGQTMVAARVGSVVVTTYDNDQNSTGTAGVALTEALVKNVTAAH
ncbi:hypothetical protein P3T36_000050 [Kitasatospora sp. MAP12-15]|uniref:hypothetical protein n=1 Tax=unclassified Kitasatospora TaxID=2633591 RepID=UPI002474B3D7|nr:hypothetical protein [Kitasatospora sp. MAP12-44]MDH6109278.1 hypothetical protein [Kitasatospora sp. MAP12-44]